MVTNVGSWVIMLAAFLICRRNKKLLKYFMVIYLAWQGVMQTRLKWKRIAIEEETDAKQNMDTQVHALYLAAYGMFAFDFFQFTVITTPMYLLHSYFYFYPLYTNHTDTAFVSLMVN